MAIGFASIAVVARVDERLGLRGRDLGDPLRRRRVPDRLRASADGGSAPPSSRNGRRSSNSEREETERAAVAEERRRIARELHDVIAHSVTLMTVQAGAARLLLAEDPERAREPVLSVEETGRHALAELRRMLGILRPDEGEASLAPQPGLARIDDLLAQARRAGLPVELAVAGRTARPPAGRRPHGLPDRAGGAHERAQARRPRARARVLRYGSEALELEVTNDGREAPNGGDGGGHGLVGMRERVALYDGTFEAGPSAGGGYAVRARLPVAVSER